MNAFKRFSLAAAIAFVIVAGIAYEVSLWQECRTDHGFFYCMRVLGK